ncbi:hypothetical protein [Pseudoalteromonas sp. OOF1S-7]|uniref:hypothetical protein n=1 Tax=Pseudoalteromonas sp. OOF1S-7 TaxID=2917757 RepID=UPI001EF5F67A|nr:hypothetical protein [Pseudoalteromonas sp. OOF1S-7]MCG7537086.1 hypothetical protein [Pseudoalteromonas sp. OOF1S-7]
MNKIIAVTAAVSTLIMLLIGITFVFSDERFGSILLAVLLLSIPLLVAHCMVCIFCRTRFRQAHPGLNKVGQYAFIATACVYVYWNALMLLDIWQKGYMSEAHGYTGLILWLGGGQALFVGAGIGFLIHVIANITKKFNNKQK